MIEEDTGEAYEDILKVLGNEDKERGSRKAKAFVKLVGLNSWSMSCL